MIKVSNISFHYPSNSLPVFKDFTWTVEKNDSWAIIGPSGCGKTTLLYLIAGLLHPNGGDITVEKIKLDRPRPKSGLILQDYGLLPWATVRENSELGLKIHDYYGADGVHAPLENKSQVDDKWLTRLGLGEFADKYPSQLSGGQRQRTAIARTLNLEPDLLLMDEPFSSVDALTRDNLQELITSLLKEENITLVIVTHTIEEALFLGGKILLLNMPPNEKPLILENPFKGKKGVSESSNYRALFNELKLSLGMG